MLANAVVTDRETVFAVYAEYDAACEKMAALSYDAMAVPELLELQSRRENQSRRAPVVDHVLLAEIQSRTTPLEIGAKSWADVLATRLRIGHTEAKRRVAEAADLGPRTAVTGEPLEPALRATASAQADGQINAEHVAIIRKFFADTPVPLDATTAAQVDQDLARIACANTPETLRQCAERIAYLLNQDGEAPADERRARRRGVHLGRQDADGNRKVTGYADAELSAYLDAIFAKWAAPGMCKPDDETPCVDGTPDADTKAKDSRTRSQRQHDALKAVARSVLSSGELGQHNGLPVTVVISTTLRELLSEAGLAPTGGQTVLPMADVIRLASHANHYLIIYDDHREEPLYLGRTKRLASTGQRIVLYNRDRGCTAPGCTAPAYHTEAHHARLDYAKGGQTNISDLGLACPPHNRLVTEHGWTTRIRNDGRVEWIAPPLLESGQDRINNYWHPEELFHPPEDDDP